MCRRPRRRSRAPLLWSAILAPSPLELDGRRGAAAASSTPVRCDPARRRAMRALAAAGQPFAAVTLPEAGADRVGVARGGGGGGRGLRLVQLGGSRCG